MAPENIYRIVVTFSTVQLFIYELNAEAALKVSIKSLKLGMFQSNVLEIVAVPADPAGNPLLNAEAPLNVCRINLRAVGFQAEILALKALLAWNILFIFRTFSTFQDNVVETPALAPLFHVESP